MEASKSLALIMGLYVKTHTTGYASQPLLLSNDKVLVHNLPLGSCLMKIEIGMFHLLTKETFQSFITDMEKLTLMEAGGGLNQDICWEIGCHFSGNYQNNLKLPGFSRNYLGQRII